MRVAAFTKNLIAQLGGDYKTIFEAKLAELQKKEVLSQTKISISACPRRYLLRYTLGLTIKEKSQPLNIGAGMAKGSEIMYDTGDVSKGVEQGLKEYNKGHNTDTYNQKEMREYLSGQVFIEVGLEAYFREFYEIDKEIGVITEKKQEDIPVCEGVKYQCINDKLTSDNQIVEDKTKGQWSSRDILALDNDLQVLGNIWGTQVMTGKKVDTLLYRVLAKPTIRLKQNESMPQYLERLRERYKLPINVPDSKIFQIKLIIDQDRIQDFARSLKGYGERHRRMLCEKSFFADHSQCQGRYGTCDYLPVCTCDHLAKHIFRLRKGDVNGATEKKSEVNSDLSTRSWIIYGDGKIGKSTFCSKFPRALFLATEAGHKDLEVFKMPIDKAAFGTWAELVEAVKAIRKAWKDGKLEFDTIVIDTADKALAMCQDHVCKNLGINHPDEMSSWGLAWQAVSSEFIKIMDKLLEMGVGVVFIAHKKETVIEGKYSKETKITPTLAGKGGRYLIDTVDNIAYVDIEIDPDTGESKRIVIHRNTGTILAGDKSGKLPPKMDFDYELMKKAFKKRSVPKKNSKGNEEEPELPY